MVDLVIDLLNMFQASVIKGNAGELATLAGSMEVGIRARAPIPTDQ